MGSWTTGYNTMGNGSKTFDDTIMMDMSSTDFNVQRQVSELPIISRALVV